MKSLNDYIKPVTKLAPAPIGFCGLYIEDEDIKTLLAEEDISFDPKEFGPEKPSTEPIDSESLSADLTNALGLLGRVQDMMLMLPSKSMQDILSGADFKSLTELDQDICVFLEDFNSEGEA